MTRTTVGKWWWADGHIAGHFYDADQSPDGLTLLSDCRKCVELAGARHSSMIPVAVLRWLSKAGDPKVSKS